MEDSEDVKYARQVAMRITLYLVLIAAVAAGLRADLIHSKYPTVVTDHASGVQIITRTDRQMFPDYWADPKAPTTASQPNSNYLPAAIAGIEKALRKYPAPFLRKSLARVYVVDNLIVDGVPSGGVNCPETRTIYVDLDNLEPDEVSAWAEETVHHEFAHLLADNHPELFSTGNWSKLNSRGFKYGNGGTEAIRTGKDGDEVTDEQLKSGFVEEYSKSDADEDFATLCERLFSGDRKVLVAAAKYPVLNKKQKAVVSFYHALDPIFTEQYFKTLRPSKQKAPHFTR